MSRNVSTCRSGMISRWVSARGLMSSIATKPPALRTWSPSRKSRQKRQSDDTDDPLLTNGGRSRTHELTNGCIAGQEPGGVVVPVAATRAVDQDVVLRSELRAPP